MEQNLNQPSIGMTMSHPSLLKEGQFLILVNGNIQTVDGNFNAAAVCCKQESIKIRFLLCNNILKNSIIESAFS